MELTDVTTFGAVWAEALDRETFWAIRMDFDPNLPNKADNKPDEQIYWLSKHGARGMAVRLLPKEQGAPAPWRSHGPPPDAAPPSLDPPGGVAGQAEARLFEGFEVWTISKW
jgi:hypothetical protein